MIKIPEEITIWRFKITKKSVVSFIKYGVTGVFSFLLDFVLNWFFIDVIKMNYLYVGYIITPIILLTKFLLNKFWSFNDYGSSKGNIAGQGVKYLVLVGVNAVTNMGMMYLFYGLLDFPLFIARFVCYGIGVLWNFPVQKFWVYK